MAAKRKKLDYGVGPVGLNIIPAMHASCPAHPQAQTISSGIAGASGHPGPASPTSSVSGPAAGGSGPAGGGK